MPPTPELVAWFVRHRMPATYHSVAADVLADPASEAASGFLHTLCTSSDFPEELRTAFMTRLLERIQSLSQSELHTIVFRIASLAASYAGCMSTCAAQCVPLTIAKDILGLDNCLGFALGAPGALSLYLRHPDALVRWCLLDLFNGISPASSTSWKDDSETIAQLLDDPFPPIRQYAQFLLRDRDLDLAIWNLRDRAKSDPDKASLIAAMKQHRAAGCVTFSAMRARFLATHQGDYDRAELDRFVRSNQLPILT